MKENQWREMVVGDGEGGLTEKLTVEQRLQGDEGLRHVGNLGRSFLGREDNQWKIWEGSISDMFEKHQKGQCGWNKSEHRREQ